MELHNIPKDIAEAMTEVLDTARGVKGEEFALLVVFLANMMTAIKVVREAPRDTDEETKNAVAGIVSKALTQSAQMYAERLELEDGDIGEAFRVVTTLDGIMEQFERRVNGH